MDRFDAHDADGGAPDGGLIQTPAVRDAAQILARADADLAEADRARARIAAEGMPAIEPDALISPLLAPGEVVVTVRRSALLERRAAARSPDEPPGLGGDLYVTSQRLVLVGQRTVEIGLGEIEDALPAGERLLLVAPRGTGFSLQVANPRLLRVEIAAARALPAVRPATP